MRRMISSATALVAVAFLVLGGAVPAHAESVPVAVLGSCEDPAARGGWSGGRDQVGTGTYHDDPAPVRPRTVRLGEPCLYDGGGPSDYLTLPLLVTDPAVAPVDEDEDGLDDGAPSSVVYCDQHKINGAGGTSVNALAQLALAVDCNSIAAKFWKSGPEQYLSLDPVVFSCSYDAGTNTGTCSWAMDLAPTAMYPNHNSGTVVAQCITTGGSLVPGSAVSQTMTVATSSVSRSCSAGQHPVFTAEASPYIPTPHSAADRGVPKGCPENWCTYGGVLLVGAADPIGGASGTGYYGGTQEAPILLAPTGGVVYYGGATVAESSTFSCASSYDGPITSTWDITPLIVSEASFDTPRTDEGAWSVVHDWVGINADPGFTMADCGYLNRIDLYVCAWAGNGPDTDACWNVFWTADKWRTNTPYTGTDSDDPGYLVCDLYPTAPGCYDILNPVYVDGTEFSVVCAGAPVFEAPGWSNFGDWVPSLLGWVGATVGHYSECLFVPVNGWDRNGVVDAAWKSSPIGQLNELVMGTFGDLASMTGTCGQIVDVPIWEASMVIDTCSWSWAVPMREMLTWSVLALGGFGIISFLINTTLSLIKSPAPNPIGGDK